MIHETSQLPPGIIVPLVTPRNFADLYPLLDHVIEGGVSAVFILGTTGETLKLSQKQRLEVITLVARYLRGKVPMLVGLAAANLIEFMELMRVAYEEVGAVGVVVPHLWGGNGVEVVEELLSTSQGDLILYNNPALTSGVFFSVQQVEMLASEKRVLGIKDSSGDLEYFEQLLQIKKNQSLKVYYGPECHLSQVLQKDVDGLVTAYANIDPGLASELWKRKGEGMWEEWEALRSLVKQEGPNDYILGLKRLLKERGLITRSEVYEWFDFGGAARIHLEKDPWEILGISERVDMPKNYGQTVCSIKWRSFGPCSTVIGIWVIVVTGAFSVFLWWIYVN